jgi:type II secretory pathway component PulF
MPDSQVTTGDGRPLSGFEAVDLSSHIAGLTGAGLPLAQGLVALGEELPRGRLRQSMNELARTLESGVPLDQAVKHHYDRIPPNLRGLVVAGVRSGGLGDLLGRFATYAGIRAELKRRLWVSLAYPALTASLAIALYVVVSLFFVRQFESIYKDFQMPIPRLTEFVIATAHLVQTIWLPVVVVGGAVLCTWVSARVLLSSSKRRSLANRLPLLGPVWRSTSLAEFCHLLALLLESQLPMPEALRLTGEGVQDAEIDSSCRAMASDVEAGRPLSLALRERGLHLLGLAGLVRWAENQKSLPEVLHVAGSMFEVRARSHAAFAGTVLNFLCVLLVISIVLVIPALILPLITLISRLSG